MKQILYLKQSSQTCLGSCYGYTLFWAKGKLDIPPGAERGYTELPFTKDIQCAQYCQNVPSSEVEHFFSRSLECEKDKVITLLKQLLIHNNDVVLLAFTGFFIGHIVAIKKIADDHYQYFNCNRGVYDITGRDLPYMVEELHLSLKHLCYTFTIEKVSLEKDFHPSILKNMLILNYHFCAFIVSSPIGLFKWGLHCATAITNKSLQLFQNLSNFIFILLYPEVNDEAAESRRILSA